MTVPRMQALRMLRRLAPTAADYHSYCHRHGCIKYEAPFSSLVDYLICCEQGKLKPQMCDNGTQPAKSCANSDSHNSSFRNWDIECSVWPIFFAQPASRTKYCCRIVYPEAQQPNGRIPFHGLIHGFV